MRLIYRYIIIWIGFLAVNTYRMYLFAYFQLLEFICTFSAICIFLSVIPTIFEEVFLFSELDSCTTVLQPKILKAKLYSFGLDENQNIEIQL